MGIAHEEADLRGLLVERRLSGGIRTVRRQSLAYAHKMLKGDLDNTFGLEDWRTAAIDEVVAAVEAGIGDRITDGDPELGYIAPEHTLAGIRAHADALAPFLRDGGGTVLLATGHPTGLLDHYADLARALRNAGNRIVRVLDDHRLDRAVGAHAAGETGIRFFGGAACAFHDEAILHTHRPDYMEAMIAAVAGGGARIDLVIADHGMAGAAIAAGLHTLSIADANDIALFLAHARGRHEPVLPIEDNFTPAEFAPVTAYMLRRAAGIAV
ncbi:phosphatase [Nonomuraea sp. NPDC049419]|uniref:phosphatase n=1 Tax=Nonomuraea sp. NPDC049419 TaxID=3155772 RepID=UPI0034418D39